MTYDKDLTRMPFIEIASEKALLRNVTSIFIAESSVPPN